MISKLYPLCLKRLIIELITILVIISATYGNLVAFRIADSSTRHLQHDLDRINAEVNRFLEQYTETWRCSSALIVTWNIYSLANPTVVSVTFSNFEKNSKRYSCCVRSNGRINKWTSICDCGTYLIVKLRKRRYRLTRVAQMI